MSKDKEPSGYVAKAFDYLVGCAQVIGTVIGIIALIVSFIGLVWAVRNQAAAIQIVRVVSGDPTSTPVVVTLPAGTPLPTYTPQPPYPTWTSIPIQPTSAPIVIVVTATPLPAPPPTENTPPGTRLKSGDTWKQDGFWITLKQARLVKDYDNQGLVVLDVVASNRTGVDISASLDAHNIVVEASNGTQFAFSSGSPTTVWNRTLPNGSDTGISFDSSGWIKFKGDFFSPSVSYIRVIVRNWSRIREAVWQIDVHH